MTFPTLQQLGWTGLWAERFRPWEAEGLSPARVVAREKSRYHLAGEHGPTTATLSGRLRHGARHPADLPAVGDWVAVRPDPAGGLATIAGLVPRTGCFARKPAISGGRKLHHDQIDGGSTEEQVIAANIDTAFIVTAMDGDFNLARLERFITMVYSSGASPVILLNKADLGGDREAYRHQASQAGPGIPVLAISAACQSDLPAVFAPYLRPGKSLMLVGSSGVGKSTIINRLLGDSRLRTNAVNESTGKGRHTTTGAVLVAHPSGCMVVDTAGVRELQLWCDEAALEESFDEIHALAARCRYSDCQHREEPGCAIAAALQDGTLSPRRYESYTKLYTEVGRLKARQRQWESHLNRRLKRTVLGSIPDR